MKYGLVILLVLVTLFSINKTYAWDNLSITESQSIIIGNWIYYDTWTSTGNYIKGDIVYYEGKYYIAIKPHIPNVIAPDSHVAWVFWEELN